MLASANIGRFSEEAGAFQEGLAALEPLLFPAYCKEHILAVLAAYFDDSGTHGDSPLVSVGGLFSTVDRWVVLASEWRQVMSEQRLDFFRMADFESGQGPYSGWSRRRHEYLIKRLVGIIKRHTFGSASRSIVKAAYESLSRTDQQRIGTPQTICAEASMFSIVQRLRPTQQIAYFFEAGPGWSDVLTRSRADDWRQQFRVASLSFVPKTDYPQIQTADILAYEARKDALRHCGMHTRAQRKTVVSLLKRGSHENNIFRTEDHVRSIVESLRA